MHEGELCSGSLLHLITLLLSLSSFKLNAVNTIKTDFLLSQGQLTGVCGSVGSGKTSLISAILGQMHTTQGSCVVSGSFAYAAQESWIFNATLQENILFGSEMDEGRYEKAIFACCLKQDLEILADGDMTEVIHS